MSPLPRKGTHSVRRGAPDSCARPAKAPVARAVATRNQGSWVCNTRARAETAFPASQQTTRVASSHLVSSVGDRRAQEEGEVTLEASSLSKNCHHHGLSSLCQTQPLAEANRQPVTDCIKPPVSARNLWMLLIFRSVSALFLTAVSLTPIVCVIKIMKKGSGVSSFHGRAVVLA